MGSTMIDEAVRARQLELLHTMASYQPIRGLRIRLSDSLKDAFMATPRHKFVHHFRLMQDRPGAPIRSVYDPDAMDVIYSDRPLLYVNSSGRTLWASSSEPSFIFHLLSLLRLEPDQDILEVGCGTGWLLAVMAKVIGPKGSATGIEILEELAAQAVRNIDGENVANAEVLCGNGYVCPEDLKGRQFDRVIFTAALAEFPDYLFEVVKVGGLVLVPLRHRGLSEEVILLRRTESGFDSEAIRLCKFVPMTGGQYLGQLGMLKLPVEGFWPNMLKSERNRTPFRLSADDLNMQLYAALPFSGFLSRTQKGFCVFSMTEGEVYNVVFGDIDRIGLAIGLEELESAALWHRGELRALGSSDEAMSTFRETFEKWQFLGQPSGVDFQLSITRSGPTPGPRYRDGDLVWLERRGSHDFKWTLVPR